MIEGSSKAIALLEKFLNDVPDWRRHCWQGAKSQDGKFHYGSYKPLYRNMLEGRRFIVSIEGYAREAKPSIEWLDVYFDPNGRGYVRKSS